MRKFLRQNLIPNRFQFLSKVVQNIVFLSKTPCIHCRFSSKASSIQGASFFAFAYRVVHKL